MSGSEEQKQVGVPVNHAPPMFERTLVDLVRDMRSRVRVAASMAERISDEGHSPVLFGVLFDT